jgi:hypothetical protein
MGEAAEALVPIQAEDVQMSFTTRDGFALMQRAAALLAASELVPDTFKKNIANTTIALEMAMRTGASPLAVMQNLYIVHGKPGWSSQFIIAAVNTTGKYTPLRFAVTGEGDGKTCVAWAIEKATGERLESPPVSIGMAKKEGWYERNGSKWKTMEDLMLRYRAATFFGRLYAPEVLMGMKTVEEIVDITPPEEEIQPGEPSRTPTKGVDGLKAKLGIVSDSEPEKKDPPPETEKKDTASSSASTDEGKKAEAPTTDREPGADEGEDGALPFGTTEKAPVESAEIPAYLNRATSIEDLSVRWLAGQPVIEKAGPRMQEAFKKLRDDREKALKK